MNAERPCNRSSFAEQEVRRGAARVTPSRGGFKRRLEESCKSAIEAGTRTPPPPCDEGEEEDSESAYEQEQDKGKQRW